MTGPEDFVRRFGEFWSRPDPPRLGELLTSDVTLVQPLSAATHGLEAAQGAFLRMLAQFLDLRATVDVAKATPHDAMRREGSA